LSHEIGVGDASHSLNPRFSTEQPRRQLIRFAAASKLWLTTPKHTDNQ